MFGKYSIIHKHKYGFRLKHSNLPLLLHLLEDTAGANYKTTKDKKTTKLGVFLDV